MEELKENEFNLNVPRYVDISTHEEPVDVSEVIEKINIIKNDIVGVKEKVTLDLEELGWEIIS